MAKYRKELLGDNEMGKYIKYLWYVIRHKWYVMLECFKEKIILRGITHDISKLLPSEFIPYANYFYGNGNNIKRGRDETGYYQAGTTGCEPFDFAWLLHQKRNKHHWQWWVLPLDDGDYKILTMSFDDATEMICDWKGAGRAQGSKKKDDCIKWYNKNKHKMKLHIKTRKYIEDKLGV